MNANQLNNENTFFKIAQRCSRRTTEQKARPMRCCSGVRASQNSIVAHTWKASQEPQRIVIAIASACVCVCLSLVAIVILIAGPIATRTIIVALRAQNTMNGNERHESKAHFVFSEYFSGSRHTCCELHCHPVGHPLAR